MSSSTITLLFLLFAVIMFVLEKIPLGVTSMIVCCGLVVTRVLDVKTAFAGFIDSNVILFVAMFIEGGALFETGMANKIGGIVTKFASSERTLIVAIMVIVGVMSGVLSNTGTAEVLIPVVIGIAAKSGYSRSRLLMPLVFAAAMGGNLSLIGAPGNLIAQSELQKNGLSFGFFEYAIVGVPILICGILFYATIGHRLLPDREPTDDGAFDTTKNFDDVPKWKQIVSLVVLVLTLLGMIFEEQIGIKLCVTGCIGALVLILTGVISEKDALKSIDLKTIFLFCGTLSLASALGETGAGEMIAGKVIAMLGDNPSPYVLTFVVFVLCCLLTNFISNTATTALMAPICMSIVFAGIPIGVAYAQEPPITHAIRTALGSAPMPCAMDIQIGAIKHNGRRSGRIYIYGLCKSWIPVDYHCYSREHDYFTNCISFFPVRKKIVFIGNNLNETYTLLYKSCIYKF